MRGQDGIAPARPAGLDEERMRRFLEAAVAAAFDLPAEDISRPTRCGVAVAFARQVAMYVAHVDLGLSLTAAGRLFGRDRTTAAHACQVVEDRRDEAEVETVLAAIETAAQAWWRLGARVGEGVR
mgnify:CR=1 FL=1